MISLNPVPYASLKICFRGSPTLQDIFLGRSSKSSLFSPCTYRISFGEILVRDLTLYPYSKMSTCPWEKKVARFGDSLEKVNLRREMVFVYFLTRLKAIDSVT